MDTLSGDIAFKLIGALIAAIDQQDPNLVERMRGILALNVDGTAGEIALGSVEALIGARPQRG